MRRLLVLLLLAAFVFAGAAVASPPRRAYLAASDLPRLRRALEYFDRGCVQRAPREWICPDPPGQHR